MRQHAAIILLTACAVLLVAANLLWGSLDIPLESVLRILSGESESQNPAWRFIVLESRIPQALTALLCGASLSTCGLMLQTLFRNPLAGPGILGIDAGANLGVALVMLLLGGSLGLGRNVLDRADEEMSMSRMTFPHQLARVMLLEQLYRAEKIIAGERYHK